MTVSLQVHEPIDHHGSLAGGHILSDLVLEVTDGIDGRVRLRNRVLVGATLAILIVAGTINGLRYVLSLYFQNPRALDMSALQAGLAPCRQPSA